MDFEILDFKYKDETFQEGAVNTEYGVISFTLKQKRENIAYFETDDDFPGHLEIDLRDVENRLEGLERVSATATFRNLVEAYDQATQESDEKRI